MLATGARPVWGEKEQDERPGMVATFRHLRRHPGEHHHRLLHGLHLPHHPDRGRGVRWSPSKR